MRSGVSLAREMGVSWIGRRAEYAIQEKFHILRRRLPVSSWSEQSLGKFVRADIPSDPAAYTDWRQTHAGKFFFHQPPTPAQLHRISHGEAVRQAEALLRGSWVYFGAIPVAAGFPPDWHRNPFSGQLAPVDLHWSEMPDFAFGDIKLIWEASRFSPVYTLVRAYALTADERYPEAFWTLVEDWAAHNPPQLGLNWKCGQEAAFRLMAWCFGLYGFAESPSSTAERVRMLAAMVAVTGERIEANLGYALSQQNNHGISEAVGLFTAGILFPEFRRSEVWRRRGRQLLESQVQSQIYDDGSYIQHSTTYQRVMLDDLLWAARLGEVNETRFSDDLYERLQRSVNFLDTITDAQQGRVPNCGNNDGALILPLTDCAYDDFRPIVQSGFYLTSRQRRFQPGPWDEALLWMFGEQAMAAGYIKPRPVLQASTGGYYTLRGLDSWGVMRCASYRDRPAQADQLHLDLWWHGTNIALDSGTYLYNPEPEWYGTFVGTAAHNTVTVDHSDQMRRFSRFLWLDWARGKITRNSRDGKWDCLEGEHDGYKGIDVVHRRCVIHQDDTWIVVDDLIGSGEHAARLHWLLADLPHQADIASGDLVLETTAGTVGVKIVASAQSDISLVRGGQIVAGKTHGTSGTRGWVSRTYAQKEPALSLVVEAESRLPIRFVTVLEFGVHRLESLTTSQISLTRGAQVSIQLNPPGAPGIVRRIGAHNPNGDSLPVGVLLVHQAFASPAEGGGTRHFEFGRRLVARGHKLTVVTSDLSYLSGKPVLERHGLFVEQDIEGLRVLRAYAYPALHRSFVWRVFSFLTFAASSLLTGLRCGPVDVVMGTSPPIFQALSAWMIAFVRHRPFLLEVRDLWPEFAIDMGVLRNSFLIWLSRRLEHFLYSRATHVLVNSPAYRDYLLKLGVAPLKISLISNGVDPAMFDPASPGEAVRRKWALQDKFVVTYTGAIGMANDLDIVLSAAGRLRQYQNILFLIVGDGKERARLEKRARELQLHNVMFTGTVSKAEVAEVMAASDACLAILKNIPMFRTTYPNKVFDYMAAGRPTLLAIDGVIREVIDSCQGGIFVSPGDHAALAGAVLKLHGNPEEARRMGQRAREYVVAHFHREQHAEQFAALVESIAGAHRSREHRFYRSLGKRLFDLALTVPAGLLIAPLLLLVSLLIKLTSPGPVFFNQDRLGKKGKVFHAYKFRTMIHRVRTHHVEIREGNPEVTRLGRFLRRFKLDELPQILNVIRGDMSLVGPRPPLPSQLAEYDTTTAHRLDVSPGITGLAQVSGGTHMTWQERWLHDLDYVRRLSFGLDMSILLRTFLVVLLGEAHFYTPPNTVGE